MVLSNCFALHRDYNPSAIANHMACLFERALLHYPAAPSATEPRRWTWCIDMYGFGASSCSSNPNPNPNPTLNPTPNPVPSTLPLTRTLTLALTRRTLSLTLTLP